MINSGISLKTGLLVLAVLTAGISMAQPAGGRLQTEAGLDFVSLVGDCVRPSVSGTGTVSIGGGCSIPTGFGGHVDTAARFKAPSAFDPTNPSAYRLAEVGASATATINVYSSGRYNMQLPNGTILRDPFPQVMISAGASYRDYLQLGMLRPASLDLEFELSGMLQILPHTGYPSQATLQYKVSAMSGRYDPHDGSFGGLNPAFGEVRSNKTLASGGSPTTAEDLFDDAGGAFGHAAVPNQAGGTSVRVTLGNPFFNNLQNDWLLLDFGIGSIVSSPAAAIADIPFSSIQSASTSADFIGTLRMVGLTAYDEVGNDITASAIMGFQSMMAPIPEPEAYAMLLAGLVMLGWSARRRPPLAAKIRRTLSGARDRRVGVVEPRHLRVDAQTRGNGRQRCSPIGRPRLNRAAHSTGSPNPNGSRPLSLVVLG